jgi:hypothetical protein
MTPDHGGRLRLALAAAWLLDAALQYQPFMFTRAFGQSLAMSAQGNPRLISDPITWSAGIVEQHPAVTNAAFATIQLIIALGIAWRPAVKFALAASVAWSIAVWWLGEGLGGVLTGSASPWNDGAPGAVIIYALLAVLLWPGGRDAPASFVAGRPFGRLPARLLWLTLWGSMAFLTLQSASMPSPGQQASALLALVFDLVAIGIFLPVPYARVAVIMAAIAATASWVIGEDFGALFTGSATDPNTGPLLVLLAAAYWPAHAASRSRSRNATDRLTLLAHPAAQLPRPGDAGSALCLPAGAAVSAEGSQAPGGASSRPGARMRPRRVGPGRRPAIAAALGRSAGGAPAPCGGGRRPPCVPPRRARGVSPRGRRASSRA